MKKLIIIVGPTRTGTTSAWTILKNLNLDILCLSKIKENYYFHDNHDLSNYLTNFKNPSEFAIDFAPSLFHRDQALENLNRLLSIRTMTIVMYTKCSLSATSSQLYGVMTFLLSFRRTSLPLQIIEAASLASDFRPLNILNF